MFVLCLSNSLPPLSHVLAALDPKQTLDRMREVNQPDLFGFDIRQLLLNKIPVSESGSRYAAHFEKRDSPQFQFQTGLSPGGVVVSVGSIDSC